MLGEFAGRRVVLLQGPMGPFFSRFARDLRAHGAKVTKVHFNAGDALFYSGGDIVRFRGGVSQWRDVFEGILRDRDADAVFLFGEHRPLHEIARQVCSARNVDVYVFEEGYLRPDCITIEKGGVNKNSSMPRDLCAYADTGLRAKALRSVGDTYRFMASFAFCYSLAITFFWWLYPGYRHHKNLNAFYQFYRGVIGFARYHRYAFRERALLEALTTKWSKRYFLVPLQVFDDYQVRSSRFEDVPHFIEHVIESFARNRRSGQRLVFKHHPLDRSYTDYTTLIRSLARKHKLRNRVLYVHDLHLPTLLRHAKATIVINSTVGFSSLFHGTPVKVMDDAVYAVAGLVVDLPLDALWRARLNVDRDAFKRVRAYMIRENQGNGSFYRRLPGAGPSGVIWPGTQELEEAAEADDSDQVQDLEPDSDTLSSRPHTDVVPASRSSFNP